MSLEYCINPNDKINYHELLDYLGNSSFFLPHMLESNEVKVKYKLDRPNKLVDLFSSRQSWKNTVFHIKDGLFYDGASCIIDYNSNKHIAHPCIDTIYESGEDWYGLWDKKYFNCKKHIKRVSGRTLLLSGFWSNEFFHFYCDVLGKIAIVSKFYNIINDFDHIVIGNNSYFERAWILKLGIDAITFTPNSDFCYLCDDLFIPTLPHTTGFFTFETIEFIRNTMGYKNNFYGGDNLIYISRAKSKKRMVINEDEICKLLVNQYGFSVIILEDLSIYQQSKIFSTAKIIVSPHGAGLSNLVFSSPNTKLIELFGMNYLNNCYCYLSGMMNIDYSYICSSRTEGSNFYVDAQELNNKLTENNI